MSNSETGLWDALQTVTGERVNQLGAAAGCDPLHWQLWPYTGDDSVPQLMLLGHIDAAEDAVEPLAAPWVRWLGLETALAPAPGTLEYHGTVDGIHLILRGITDRDAYQRPH